MSKIPTLFFLLLILCFSTPMVAQQLYLEVEGTSENGTNILDSLEYKQNFADYSSLNIEVDSILYRTERIGYYEQEYSGIDKKNDSTYIVRIKLNERYKWIRILDGGIFSSGSVRNQFPVDETGDLMIPVEKIEAFLNELANILANEGDPFFKIRLVNIKRISKDTLEGSLAYNGNEKRRIDKIVLKGYEKFPRSYLRHYLRIKENQIFDLNKIRSKAKNLENLRFAKNQKDPEVLFTPDSTLLYIYVEKMPSNNFDGFLGFGTEEGSGKLQFDGYLNLRLLNNLNYGESMELYYKSDESQQRTFDVKLELPYIFRTPLGLKTELNIFKKDSTFLTSSQRAALVYQFNNKHQLAAGISSHRSDLLEGTQSISLTDFSSTLYSIEYSFNQLSQNNPLFPIRSRFDLLTEIGNRESFGESTAQSKFSLETFNIFQLNDQNHLFGRITAAYLISDNYLENELFRFGGINSIRGFKENTLVANLYGVINTEYRYLLNPQLYVHTVFDAAYFENSIIAQKEKLIGFGFGFGLLTNAGLLKLNYSGSKVNNENVKLSDFKIHISLNANF